MQNELTLSNGVTVKVDSDGLLSLTDLWHAAGSPNKKDPSTWQKREGTIEFIDFVKDTLAPIHNTPKSGGYKKGVPNTILKGISNPIIKSKKGKGGGTYAHKQVALAYAKYLSPELHYAVNQIFFERLEEEKNPELALDRAVKTWEKQGKTEEWIAKRLKAKSTRKRLTGALKLAGCDQKGYRDATNAMYAPQYGGTAARVREKLGLPEGANTREGMSEIQLTAIELTELLAAQNIEKKGLFGNNACVQECNTVSRGIAKAIKDTLFNAA